MRLGSGPVARPGLVVVHPHCNWSPVNFAVPAGLPVARLRVCGQPGVAALAALKPAKAFRAPKRVCPHPLTTRGIIRRIKFRTVVYIAAVLLSGLGRFKSLATHAACDPAYHNALTARNKNYNQYDIPVELSMADCEQCGQCPATVTLTSAFDPFTTVARVCASCDRLDGAALRKWWRNGVDSTSMPAQIIRYRIPPRGLAVSGRGGLLSGGWDAETGHGRLSAMTAPVTVSGADVYISLRRRHPSYCAYNRVLLTELKRTNPDLRPAYDLTALADIDEATRAMWTRAFVKARCLPVETIVAVKCAGVRLVHDGKLPAELWAMIERVWWGDYG